MDDHYVRLSGICVDGRLVHLRVGSELYPRLRRYTGHGVDVCLELVEIDQDRRRVQVRIENVLAYQGAPPDCCSLCYIDEHFRAVRLQ